MASADCTDTMPAPTDRPRAVRAVALAWLAGRQLAWWSGRALDRALAWTERARQRRHLAGLNDYMLRDIGLTRADVDAETRKPFWQP